MITYVSKIHACFSLRAAEMHHRTYPACREPEADLWPCLQFMLATKQNRLLVLTPPGNSSPWVSSSQSKVENKQPLKAPAQRPGLPTTVITSQLNSQRKMTTNRNPSRTDSAVRHALVLSIRHRWRKRRSLREPSRLRCTEWRPAGLKTKTALADSIAPQPSTNPEWRGRMCQCPFITATGLWLKNGYGSALIRILNFEPQTICSVTYTMNL